MLASRRYRHQASRYERYLGATWQINFPYPKTQNGRQ